jgi:putative hydrolase of the HAD superfamily
MIKAIFFDFFNTIANYDKPREQIYLDICKEHGVEVDPKALYQSLPKADSFYRDENRRNPIDDLSKEEQFAFWVKYVTLALKGAGVEADKELASEILKLMMQSRWEFKLYDDSLPILKQLREKGIKLGLISNVAKDVDDLFTKLGLQQHLDFIVTSFEVGRDKPEPEIFLAALQKAGLPPEEVIYVGDQYDLDVVGARNVGMKAILIDRADMFPEITDCPRILELAQITEYI